MRTLNIALPILLASPLARAMRPPPPIVNDQMTEGATIIARTVEPVRNAVVELDGEKLPVRYFPLGGITYSSADVPKLVELLLPGGIDGDFVLSYPEVPKVDSGDQVVLIGTIDSAGTLRLSSFNNSVFIRGPEGQVLDGDGYAVSSFACSEATGLVTDGKDGIEWDAFSESIKLCGAKGE